MTPLTEIYAEKRPSNNMGWSIPDVSVVVFIALGFSKVGANKNEMINKWSIQHITFPFIVFQKEPKYQTHARVNEPASQVSLHQKKSKNCCGV